MVVSDCSSDSHRNSNESQHDDFYPATVDRAFAAVSAAAIAAWVSRAIKISEFRQAWINDLRKDIADYIGAAERWFRKYDELNTLTAPERADREQRELFPIANEARVILWRIKLRFNPRVDNPPRSRMRLSSRTSMIF